MQKRKQSSSEIESFVLDLFYDKFNNEKGFEKIKKYGIDKASVSGIFTSQIYKNPNKTIEEIFENDWENFIVINLDKEKIDFLFEEALNLKDFLIYLSNELINHRDVIVDFHVDCLNLVWCMDILYGYILAIAKENQDEGVINLGRLKINVDKQCKGILEALLFRSFIERGLYMESREILERYKDYFRNKDASEFYNKVIKNIDFLKTQSLDSIFLINCFYTVVDSSNNIYEWISKVMVYEQELEEKQEVLLEIQSTYLYNLDRFSIHSMSLLNNIFKRHFNQTLFFLDEKETVEKREKFFEDYLELLKTAKIIYFSETQFDNVINLINALKTKIENA